MKWLLPFACVASVAAGGPGARADDVELRARAVALMNHAHLVSTPNTRGRSVETTADFEATTAEGSHSGHLVRLRGAKGYVKERVDWSDFHATMLGVGMQEATTGGWENPPYPVRKLFDLVPFSVGEFDSKDAIREIKSSTGSGAATCVLFETIEGDKREPGEICFDGASGVMLRAHVGDRSFEYSRYFELAGARVPGHIDYEERGGLSLSIDLSMRVLDSVPEDTFAFTPGAMVGQLCRRYSEPLPLATPQPRAGAGQGASVVTVLLHATVTAVGAVVDPQVVRSAREDLNAEAMETVLKWQFQPGTCNGDPTPYPLDLQVQFQGR